MSCTIGPTGRSASGAKNPSECPVDTVPRMCKIRSASPTCAARLGSPLPHLHRNLALAHLATSAPGLGAPCCRTSAIRRILFARCHVSADAAQAPRAPLYTLRWCAGGFGARVAHAPPCSRPEPGANARLSSIAGCMGVKCEVYRRLGRGWLPCGLCRIDRLGECQRICNEHDMHRVPTRAEAMHRSG